MTDEFDYTSYIKFASDRLQALRRAKNGYLIGRFADKIIDRKTGEVIWDGEQEVNRIRKCLEYKDCFFSKKIEENTGAFYDQTLYSPCEKNKLIRIKDNLPAERYGGYSSDQFSYFAIVEIDNGKKKTKRLLGIPIRVAGKAKTDKEAIVKYFEECLKTNRFRILLPKVNRLQLLQYNDHTFYLSSADEIHNAKQLILNTKYLKTIENIIIKPQLVNDEEYLQLYDCLVEKVNIHYSFYESFARKLYNARAEFSIRNSVEKAKIIFEILKVTKASPIRGNFAALSFGDMSTSEGRKEVVLDIDKVIFIHTSITGMLSNVKKGSDFQ
jgi:CRISPR-associated endonuclease Csn1